MPQAVEDLEGIEEFIGIDNPIAAINFIEKLTQRFDELIDMPGMGRKRDDLSPGLRSSRVGDHLIFYRVSEDKLEVIHVLHGAQDLPRFFEQD